jgi:alpha-L-fucosidase
MLSRRDFVRKATAFAAAAPLAAAADSARTATDAPTAAGPDSQRLSAAALQAWEALQFGMFLHFGMSTFTGQELSDGRAPAATYAPTHLDPDQWVSVARDMGMKYAVLTAKHVAGHCLWPSACTDYTVTASPVKTDVVEAFVRACERRGVLPGLYYCSWDNHNRFGSVTETDLSTLSADQKATSPWWTQAYTTRRYQEFQWQQLEELLTRYGRIAEVWIDIPGVLPRSYRNDLYAQIARWQPQTVIVMNGGGGLFAYPVGYAWPTDVATLERHFPNSRLAYPKRRRIEDRTYYLPGEMCDTLARNWFWQADDPPRSDAELLGMYAVARARGVNVLLDVPPDRTGRLPAEHVAALRRLRSNLDRFPLA